MKLLIKNWRKYKMNSKKMAEAIEFYKKYPDKFIDDFYPEFKIHTWQKVYIRALAKSELVCLLMYRGRYWH